MSKEKGEISKSMGVDTKPAKQLNWKGYWILVDPKMSESDLKDIKLRLGLIVEPKPIEKDCNSCRYKSKDYFDEPCISCGHGYSNYKAK